MSDIKVLYGFVCDDVRQEVGGKMTYVGQTEVFFIQQLPVVFTKLCVVYSVMGPKGKYRVDVKIRGMKAGDSVVQVPSHEVEINSPEHKIREVIQLNSLKIDKDGHFVIQVFFNDQRVHEFYFSVNLVAQPPLKDKPDASFNLPIIMSSMN